MLEYFSKKRAKRSAPVAQEPVLTEEDELFLQRIMSEPEGAPPVLPPRPQDLHVAGESVDHDQQIVLHGDSEQPLDSPKPVQRELTSTADQVPLPESTDAEERALAAKSPVEGEGKGKGRMDDWKNRFSFLRRGSGAKRKAEDLKESPKSPTAEHQKEAEDLESIMEQLNLAAVNNRVFSLSDESKELLRKFTIVLKDVVRGVPTAYDDLEKLLTNSEDTLQKTFKSMPSWVQELIGKLPTKVTKSLGPEFLAAAAEKHGISTEALESGAGLAEKAGVKVRIPSLKELVTKQGAIVGLLRAIVNFLRTRFPAVIGLNVLWSVAIFFLLLVLWYCHKRGKEVRLEKERHLTETEMEAIRAQVAAEPPADYDPEQEMPTTTTAAHGASVAEVQRGIAEVQAARAAQRAADTSSAEAQLESSLYAPGGSLSASLRADEEAASRRSASPSGTPR